MSRLMCVLGEVSHLSHHTISGFFLYLASLPSSALYTMLFPPVEEAVLQNNPDFAALYSTLTTAVLNPDGTTKDDKSIIARQRDAVREVHSSQPRLSSVVFCCN
jgi:hypothetical protein